MAATLGRSESRTASIRALAIAGQNAQAAEELALLIKTLFDLDVKDVQFNADQYSLNSLNGFFVAGTQEFFFKFHQEDGEEAMTGEYYRAEILAQAGLPVDMPLYTSALPGEQILVYRRRFDPRFADILRDLDVTDEAVARAEAVGAEKRLSEKILDVYQHSLHPIAPTQAAAEPIHRLFYDRLVDPPAHEFPGGRYRNFYIGQTVHLPGLDLTWDGFASCRFVVNGVAYRQNLRELFANAHIFLQPSALAASGGCVAHGDAHNANVWFRRTDADAHLEFFDPAFAGEHVPSLLAEVKATFHNIFAHPFWLYDPDEAAKRFSATARQIGDAVYIDTDWALTAIRRDLLTVKSETLWRPWLRWLAARDMLPANWRQILKLALFLCPTLVMNLRAGPGRQNPISSAIGFAVAVMAGSEPEGRDVISDFLDAITP